MATLPEEALTGAQIAALRSDYEAGSCALDVLAARFALSRRALTRLAARLNFGARPPATPFRKRSDGAPSPLAEREGGHASGDGPASPQGERRRTSKPSAATKTAPPKSPAARKAATGKAATGKPATGKAATGKPATAKAAPEKSPAAPRRSSARAKGGGEPALKPLDMAATAARIQRAAEQELEKIHDRLEAGEDVERRARALSSLVRTLGDLARLEQARAGADAALAACADDGAGWTLDDLRAELARRIDRLEPDPPAAPLSGDARRG